MILLLAVLVAAGIVLAAPSDPGVRSRELLTHPRRGGSAVPVSLAEAGAGVPMTKRSGCGRSGRSRTARICSGWA
ncbi:hypothetical protein IOD13_01830 [Brevibacterium casei]|nr:hypothetical protein [Brevibacterium casei]